MRSIKVALLLGATAALAGCNVTTNPVELSDGMHVRFPAEVPPESDREAKLAAVTNTALISLYYMVAKREPGETPAETASREADDKCDERFILHSPIKANLLTVVFYFYCLSHSIPFGTKLPAPPAIVAGGGRSM